MNPDLQAAGLNNEQLFDHFRAFGINEGRQASNSFSVGFYLAANPNLQAAGFNNQQALQHYVFFGIAEGRIAAPGVAVTPVTQTPPPPQNTGDPFPPAGTTLNASRDLGVLNGSLNLTDFVGEADRNDYYRFVLANNSEFGLTLGALTDSAYVQLIKDYNQNGEIDDGDGDVLKRDYGSSSRNGTINQALAAGTYFIRVYPEYSDDNTNYNLKISAQARAGVINNNSNIDISANIDPLTNSSTVNELPASADFGNVALNDANVSLIQQFTGNSAVELGNVASNQLPNTASDLIGDALGIGADFGSGFSSNLLDNANFNSTLSLL